MHPILRNRPGGAATLLHLIAALGRRVNCGGDDDGGAGRGCVFP